MGTVLMTAAGWWCQLVRYPAFRNWNDIEFVRRHSLHTFQISLIVVPGLIFQIAGASLLMVSAAVAWLKLINVVSLLGSLGPTFLISAPLHRRLSTGKCYVVIERLIRTNLPRTLFWTIHFLVALAWRFSAANG